MKEDINKIFEEEGFGLSAQAKGIFEKLDNQEIRAKQMVALLKRRKFMIGGGDVMSFIIRNKLPESPSQSKDLDGMRLQ